MMFAFGDKKPKILGSNYFIAISADIIGSVIIHNNVSILFNAVVRGDNGTIEIEENTNIQDGAVLHTNPGLPMQIGKNVTIGHNAMVHCSKVGDYSVIAIGANILSHAVIGKNCMIGANALVLEKQIIPDNSFVIGTGKIKSQLTQAQIKEMKKYSQHYVNKIPLFNKLFKVISIK